MKKTIFNLRQYKKAFYEGAQGYMLDEDRSFKNCQKQKADKGMTPHEAKLSCIEEFQDKEKWAGKYGASDNKVVEPKSAKTPAAEKIK